MEKKVVPSNLIEFFAQVVSLRAGIQLGAAQHSMVESRVRKRLVELGIATLEEYAEYYRENEGEESEELISLLTTHHTYFFREPVQFRFLEEVALPQALNRMRARGESKLRIWSAACSTGQEVYTLAMFLQHHLPVLAPGVGFEILGTDVDKQSVTTARNGVYALREMKSIPLLYTADHWAKGSGDISGFAKAKPSLRDHCRFESYNLSCLLYTSPSPRDS